MILTFSILTNAHCVPEYDYLESQFSSVDYIVDMHVRIST